MLVLKRSLLAVFFLLSTSFVMNQLAAQQTITLNPPSLSNVAAAGATQTVTITYGGDADSYTLSGVPDWVTVPSTATDGNISVTIKPNTGEARTTSAITFTPTGGTGVVLATILPISQVAAAAALQTIMLAPTSLTNLPASGATRAVTITYGGGANAYTLTGVPDWATVPTTVTDGSISIMVDANTGGVRAAQVTFTPTGGTGGAEAVLFLITQAAAPVNRTVTLAPTGIANVAAAGSTTMVVLTLGGDATGYSVPASGTGAPPSWVTGIPATGMASTLSVVVMPNTGVARSATIVFTPTGGMTGTVTPTNFVINQLAPTPRTVDLTPTSLSGIAATGSTEMVMVALGGDATGYSVPASGTGSVPSWVTGIAATGMAGTISMVVMPNTGTTRMATIVFTPTGGMTGTVTPTNFTISQLGAPVNRIVTLAPNPLVGVAGAGSTEMVALTLGGGATGYSVPASGMTGAPPSWVTGIATTGMAGTLSVMVGANTGAAREATIVFTPTGGMTGAVVTTNFVIRQLAAPAAAQTITLLPDGLTGVAAAGSTTPVMITYGGDADAYTLSGVPDWATVPTTATMGSISVVVNREYGCCSFCYGSLYAHRRDGYGDTY